jgi:hypothetical protein
MELRFDAFGEFFDGLGLGQARAPSTSMWPSASRAISKRSMSFSWPRICVERKVRSASSASRCSIDDCSWKG